MPKLTAYAEQYHIIPGDKLNESVRYSHEISVAKFSWPNRIYRLVVGLNAQFKGYFNAVA